MKTETAMTPDEVRMECLRLALQEGGDLPAVDVLARADLFARFVQHGQTPNSAVNERWSDKEVETMLARKAAPLEPNRIASPNVAGKPADAGKYADDAMAAAAERSASARPRTTLDGAAFGKIGDLT